MATTNSLLLLLLLISTPALLSATSSTANSTYGAAPNTSLISAILSTLGFQELSSAVAATNLSATTPTTIFAPTDSSLATCPTCSIPLLLQEHSVPGLYSLHFLRTLAFGTKIGSFAANRCLTVTSTTGAATTADKKVFINGIEIAKPDLFNNGVLIVHSVKGFVSHLSPISCVVQSMTTLSFPHQPPPINSFLIMRFMLKDAMASLRVKGFSVAALAMRVKYSELSDLNSMTVFAIDDESIFLDGGAGHTYVAELGSHIVPNRLLMAADLVSLPKGTVLPTMERARSVVVTNDGGGGPLRPMRINYEKVKRFDLVYNNRIVVHGLSMPFRHVDQPEGIIGNSRLKVSAGLGAE